MGDNDIQSHRHKEEKKEEEEETEVKNKKKDEKESRLSKSLINKVRTSIIISLAD